MQTLSVSIDNHFDYRVSLFSFIGDPPIAKMDRIISEGSCYCYAYFEDIIIPRIVKLAGQMHVFFILGLREGDSISKLAEQVLKETL